MRIGVKKILPKELPKHVGRWRIEKCNTKMNQKIDLSNEDHCGPCGQYALEKIDSTFSANRLGTKDEKVLHPRTDSSLRS